MSYQSGYEWPYDVLKERADRIIELEAKNAELRKQNDILATARRLEEAELAVLKARQCAGCRYGGNCPIEDAWKIHGPSVEFFACNCWLREVQHG